eukprot:11856646-Prorocentrum_lima.AAC.1
MTSSLVGSEMCIRDSIRSNGIPALLSGLTSTLASQAGSTVFTPCRNVIAVSYTHLTLPTICSV